MKTKFAIAAVALALSSSAAFASVNIGGGDVEITGRVLNNSCTITAGQSGTNAVKLADIEKKDLSNGEVKGALPFTIEVSKCDLSDNVTKLDLTLTATDLADARKGYLANTATEGAATNVYIAVKNSDGDIVVPGTATATAPIDKTNAAGDTPVVFNYTAGYITDSKDAVTAGNVKGTISYTVSYN